MFRGIESLPAHNTKISDDDDAPLVRVQAGLLSSHWTPPLKVFDHHHPGGDKLDVLVGHDLTEPVDQQIRGALPLHVLVVETTEGPPHFEGAVDLLDQDPDAAACLLNPLTLQDTGRLVVDAADGMAVPAFSPKSQNPSKETSAKVCKQVFLKTAKVTYKYLKIRQPSALLPFCRRKYFK